MQARRAKLGQERQENTTFGIIGYMKDTFQEQPYFVDHQCMRKCLQCIEVAVVGQMNAHRSNDRTLVNAGSTVKCPYRLGSKGCPLVGM